MNTKNVVAAIVAIATATAFAEGTNAPSLKPDWMHVTAGTEIWSSYHLYGAIFNDEPSWTYSGSLDFDMPFSLGSLGGGMWTLSDITDRCAEYNSKWNKETDLDVHWFNGYAFSDDWTLNYGVLYVWFNYYHTRGGDNMPTQRSVIFTTDVDNPFVTPFLSVEYQHAYDSGVMLQYGVRRCFTPLQDDRWTVTPSVYMTTASGRFFDGLFPPNVVGNGYGFGIGSIFAEVRTDFSVYEWMNVWARGTWMSVLNGDIRDSISEYGGTYHNDWLCLEVGVDFSF